MRALWAGQPFVWHIYPQDDNAHHAKLEAFLDWMQAPDSLRQAHRVWNGVQESRWPVLDASQLSGWTACTQTVRQKQMAHDHLVPQLLVHLANTAATE